LILSGTFIAVPDGMNPLKVNIHLHPFFAVKKIDDNFAALVEALGRIPYGCPSKQDTPRKIAPAGPVRSVRGLHDTEKDS